MAVAVYLRVSTEEQRERQSIATQREFGERYCQLHSLVVSRVFADDGVSGTVALDQRPDGSQILRDARLGKFDQLLVYKLDRLGRETRLILNAVAELEVLGVRIRSMTEEFDTGTSTGRLMLTLLSGFAAHEHSVIRERCVAGSLRVAEAGAWLGGIVPFGYRKVGEKRDAHLVVSEEPIPGIAMSEAEVIREIFRMASKEHASCRIISALLNTLRIPCAYVRDDRLALRGKRKERTAGIWRPGRVRNLIISKTYMGVHEYGKRTKSGRPVISRAVPAIVTEATWKKAQDTPGELPVRHAQRQESVPPARADQMRAVRSDLRRRCLRQAKREARLLLQMQWCAFAERLPGKRALPVQSHPWRLPRTAGLVGRRGFPARPETGA